MSQPLASSTGSSSDPGRLPSFHQIPALSGGGALGHGRLLRQDRFELLRRLSDGGDLYRLRILVKDVIAVISPALVQEVLVEKARHFEKSSFLRYLLYPLAGEGLFTSRGRLWRRQRKIMAPLFRAGPPSQPGQLGSYARDMVDCASRVVDTWRDGQALTLLHETTHIAMSVAGKTLFDAETFTEADEIGAALTVALNWVGHNAATILPAAQIALRQALERTAGRLDSRFGGRFSRPGQALQRAADKLHGPVILLGAEDRRLKQASELLDRRVQRMIDERRAAGLERPDLLSRLLAARDEDDGATMSDKQVRDEVLTLFVAGHETTATGLAWAIYLLARHPDIYRQVQAEADALGRSPRYEDLPRLQLASQVFKESLRLYPPVAMFSREVVEPLDLAGHHFPAGTVVFICPYATQHRADLWPDPDRFDPGRFTAAAEEARPRHAYLPFSAGPRVCIGNHFALMEGPLVLATLLQRADFALNGVSTVVPDLQATLRPEGGIPVIVRLRQPPVADRPVHSIDHVDQGTTAQL